MGTDESNLEKYKNLWNIFEELLEKEGLNLSSFSKRWEKYNDSGEENDYDKFYSKLKKQNARKNSLKKVNTHTIIQLEEYIKFLDKDFTAEEIRADELYSHWFD